jgi:hypothetical protein
MLKLTFHGFPTSMRERTPRKKRMKMITWAEALHENAED